MEPSVQKTLSRRRILVGGMAAGALLSVGGLFVWASSGYTIPEATRRRLRALSAKEFLVVCALLDRIVRLRADSSRVVMDEALFIDSFVARFDEDNRRDIRRLFQLVEHVLPTWAGIYSRFTRLSGAEQDRVLETMRTSPRTILRGAFDALKSLIVMAHYRAPGTWRSIGYDGPLVGRPLGGWS